MREITVREVGSITDSERLTSSDSDCTTSFAKPSSPASTRLGGRAGPVGSITDSDDEEHDRGHGGEDPCSSALTQTLRELNEIAQDTRSKLAQNLKRDDEYVGNHARSALKSAKRRVKQSVLNLLHRVEARSTPGLQERREEEAEAGKHRLAFVEKRRAFAASERLRREDMARAAQIRPRNEESSPKVERRQQHSAGARGQERAALAAAFVRGVLKEHEHASHEVCEDDKREKRTMQVSALLVRDNSNRESLRERVAPPNILQRFWRLFWKSPARQQAEHGAAVANVANRTRAARMIRNATNAQKDDWDHAKPKTEDSRLDKRVSAASLLLRMTELYTSAPRLQQLDEDLRSIEERIRLEDQSWKRSLSEIVTAHKKGRQKWWQTQDAANIRAMAKEAHNANARARRESLLRYERALLAEACRAVHEVLTHFKDSIEKGVAKVSTSSCKVELVDLQRALRQNVRYTQQWQVISSLPKSFAGKTMKTLLDHERQTLMEALRVITESSERRQSVLHRLLFQCELKVVRAWFAHVRRKRTLTLQALDFKKRLEYGTRVSVLDAWCCHHENEKKLIDAEMLALEERIAAIQNTSESWLEYELDDAHGRLEFIGHVLPVADELQPHGFGVMTWGDGSLYSGEWQHGKLSGFGTKKYGDGSTYVGQFEAHERHGLGVFKSMGGECYMGHWARGQRHGAGVWVSSKVHAADEFEGRGLRKLTMSVFGEFENGEHVALFSDAEMEQNLKSEVEELSMVAQDRSEAALSLAAHIKRRSNQLLQTSSDHASGEALSGTVAKSARPLHGAALPSKKPGNGQLTVSGSSSGENDALLTSGWQRKEGSMALPRELGQVERSPSGESIDVTRQREQTQERSEAKAPTRSDSEFDPLLASAAQHLQKMWVMRHGQRLDEVDDSWELTADRPYDPPLTLKGHAQAYVLGQTLARVSASTRHDHASGRGCVVVCSPFLRCVQTGVQVLKGMQQEVETGTEAAPKVLMVDYGLCEVQTQNQMKQYVPRYLTRDELVAIDPLLRDVLQHWVGTEDQDTGEGQPPFPETQEMAVTRYCKAFERLLMRFDVDNVICVTHGDAVATFAATSGFTSSKDNVYDTPHCCFAAATACSNPLSGKVSWKRREIDSMIGFISDMPDDAQHFETQHESLSHAWDQQERARLVAQREGILARALDASSCLEAFLRRHKVQNMRGVAKICQSVCTLQGALRGCRARRRRIFLAQKFKNFCLAASRVGELFGQLQHRWMAEIAHDILEKWSVFADNSHKNDCNNILAMETEREICLLKAIVSEWRVAASLELVHRSTVVMQAILRRRAAALYTRTAVLRPACVTLQCAYRCRLSRLSALYCLIHTLTNDAPGVRPAYAKYVDLLNFWRQRALAPLLQREDARQQELDREAVIARREKEERAVWEWEDDMRERRAWMTFWSKSPKSRRSSLNLLPVRNQAALHRTAKSIHRSYAHVSKNDSKQHAEMINDSSAISETVETRSKILDRSHADYLSRAWEYFSPPKDASRDEPSKKQNKVKVARRPSMLRPVKDSDNEMSKVLEIRMGGRLRGSKRQEVRCDRGLSAGIQAHPNSGVSVSEKSRATYDPSRAYMSADGTPDPQPYLPAVGTLPKKESGPSGSLLVSRQVAFGRTATANRSDAAVQEALPEIQLMRTQRNQTENRRWHVAFQDHPGLEQSVPHSDSYVDGKLMLLVNGKKRQGRDGSKADHERRERKAANRTDTQRWEERRQVYDHEDAMDATICSEEDVRTYDNLESGPPGPSCPDSIDDGYLLHSEGGRRVRPVRRGAEMRETAVAAAASAASAAAAAANAAADAAKAALHM